ncbi:DUF2470 domain-containing protein [Streptosporangium amethystogenes]|uniref:DUF2470 domain-containing protein n=1 Tax=Streptosporangium amethystogenes TaxID=2002 RepID=UPI0004C5D113|nr:DUF2470 domain-containing protein [Streptosporangium amethystogenes]
MPPVIAPPIPERVRTLAAGAAPTHVSIAGDTSPALPARGGVDTAGRPVLLVLPGDPLYDARDEPVVTVDLTSNRSLGKHELSRGLLKVQGWAQAVPVAEVRRTAVAIAERCPDEALFEVLEGTDGPRLLRVDVSRVIYLTGPESGVLDAEEYLGATPDPLMGEAERMVQHVNGAHRRQLETALGSLLAEPVPGAWLWELDRFGATVRCGVEDPTLIRLPWPSPMTDAESLEHAVRCLLCHR